MRLCGPMPELEYERSPCACGAITEEEAETKCRPCTDQTGEVECCTDFDKDGFALAPTATSLAAQNAWMDIHYDCFEGCVATTPLNSQD